MRTLPEPQNTLSPVVESESQKVFVPPSTEVASKLVSSNSCSGSHTATPSPSKPSAKITSLPVVVQVTATLVTFAPAIVPLPLATEQLWPVGWLAIVTA